MSAPYIPPAHYSPVVYTALNMFLPPTEPFPHRRICAVALPRATAQTHHPSVHTRTNTWYTWQPYPRPHWPN